MDIVTKITRINVLFDKDVTKNNPSIIIRFPVKYITEEELQDLYSFQVVNEFYIGFIDFTKNTDIIEPFLITVNGIQDALRILYEDVPFFDAHLN